MSEVPAELQYTQDHEWLRKEDDGSYTLGITDHAQSALGELVYVELPETGDTFDASDSCVVVESVKAASDVYSPVSGEIAAVNENLADEPESVNQSPYGDGWLVRIAPSGEPEGLMNAEQYQQFLEAEA